MGSSTQFDSRLGNSCRCKCNCNPLKGEIAPCSEAGKPRTGKVQVTLTAHLPLSLVQSGLMQCKVQGWLQQHCSS
jgi:hypothetical protein